jgi:uncharacterized SAM-binding protein YcdF (DUF218 family)
MIQTIVRSITQGLIFAIFAASVLFVYANHIAPSQVSAFPAVPSEKWQAVFLSGGQVYFGKLTDAGIGYVTLSDVYYLKSASELEQSNLNLVKLGGELHGPEDTIYIRKESISFWENMKDSSRVVQSIESAKR